ncbi:HIT domain-containing protein [Candidatus Woesearchaeota archaeon]|nr:HIT domain-containing protein [Candidatus Woesearchaeota archaeon]
MKKDCHYCQLIADKDKKKIYEDDKVVVIPHDKPATEGHVLVIPKEHYAIIEQVPDYIVSHAFSIANKMSVALFESLNAQGTNIIVNNGVAAGQESAHFFINVIARREGDGMDFQWRPKQLGEEEMSTIELQIKEQTKSVGEFQQEKEKPIEMQTKTRKISSGTEEKENYLLKRFRKIP